MKKIFLSFIILSILSASASAHIIYSTEDGGLGLIKVSSASSIDSAPEIKYSGEEGSVVSSYWENNTSNGSGNSKIIFISPKESSDVTVSGDTAVRFSSYQSLGNPIDSNAISLKGTYGTPVICGTNSGGSLYLATGATLREYRTLNFELRNSYTYPSKDISAPNPQIKAVTKNDSSIYVLVSLSNDKTLSTASNDVVITLDGTLNPNSEYAGRLEVRTSNDAYSMNFISDSRVAVGCADGIYRVQASATTKLVSSDAPVIALNQDTSSGIYYVTKSDDQNLRLYHFTTSTESPGTLIKTVSGDKAYITKDSDYNVLGVIMGKEILVIGMESGAVLRIFESKDLSSTPSAPISIAASSTTGNSASKSSGCMIGGTGLALMLALLISLRKEAY